MNKFVSTILMPCAVFLLLSGCAKSLGNKIPIDVDTSTPGGMVTMRGEPVQLTGSAISVGSHLPMTFLVDAFTMKTVDLSRMKGTVLVLSLVPSLDTKVCEAQTHYLGELGSRLPPGIVRITISRDTPFAQKRFAEEAKLKDIRYLSDYKDGFFGRTTGLLQKESMLLARAVILVDQEGIVRYIQVVPELSHLPDMETLFNKSQELLAGK